MALPVSEKGMSAEERAETIRALMQGNQHFKEHVAAEIRAAEASARKAALVEAAEWHEQAAPDFPPGSGARGEHEASADYFRTLAAREGQDGEGKEGW